MHIRTVGCAEIAKVKDASTISELVDGCSAFRRMHHSDGILNYCHTIVPFGVVEAINGNIRTILLRGRGYQNLNYLLLKAQRMAVTKTEFGVLRKAA